MVKNSYIDRSVQKGFLKGVAGCVEHTFSLQEILRDAYDHNRQIVVTWIDLATAYGSVMHNLIQFALEWYHVPIKARRIIFSYHDRLMAKVITNNWQTNFFTIIGLFQVVPCPPYYLIQLSIYCLILSNATTDLDTP